MASTADGLRGPLVDDTIVVNGQIYLGFITGSSFMPPVGQPIDSISSHLPVAPIDVTAAATSGTLTVSLVDTATLSGNAPLYLVLREQATGHDSVRDFLASIDRRLIAQEQALPGEGVQLATFHAAKGLEFDAVLVIGCEEGLVPHARAVSEAELESERRSFYVALTRARDHEVLLSCAERGGRRTSPSRFLRDLPLDAIHSERRATYG